MGLLAKIAVEALDGVVCEEDVDVSFSIDRMFSEWVSFGWERWVQTHPGNVDRFAWEGEFLGGWLLFLYEVDVSGSCVDR